MHDTNIHDDTHDTQNLVTTLNNARLSRNTEVVVAPPALFVGQALSGLRKDVNVAVQDVGDHSFGAHTGNIAPDMCNDLGINYAIVGHSERRAAVSRVFVFCALEHKTNGVCSHQNLLLVLLVSG